MRSKTFNMRVLVIAASGIVTLGALVAAIGQGHTATASATMSIGSTTTVLTPAATPQTTVAVPAVKAVKPKGF